MNDHEVRRLEGEIMHLRELVTEFRTSDKEALAAAMAAAKEAIAKAEDATERRLELLNEFRGQAEQQQREFLRIPVYEAKHTELINRVDQLAKQFETLNSAERFSAGRNLGYMGAAFTLGGAVIGVIFKLLE